MARFFDISMSRLRQVHGPLTRAVERCRITVFPYFSSNFSLISAAEAVVAYTAVPTKQIQVQEKGQLHGCIRKTAFMAWEKA